MIISARHCLYRPEDRSHRSPRARCCSVYRLLYLPITHLASGLSQDQHKTVRSTAGDANDGEMSSPQV